MTDFLAALGLLLVIEGVVFAAWPGFAKEAMRQAAESAPERMRIVGIICAAAGVGLVWLARRVF
jgi:uncharacterized protein